MCFHLFHLTARFLKSISNVLFGYLVSLHHWHEVYVIEKQTKNNVDWKQKTSIGNIEIRWKTKIVQFRNNHFKKKTQSVKRKLILCRFLCMRGKLCFQSQMLISKVRILFPIPFYCFKTTRFAAKPLFRISIECFRCTYPIEFVYFQSILMFPTYLSNDLLKQKF